MTNLIYHRKLGDNAALERKNYHDVGAIAIIAAVSLGNFFLTNCWEHFVAVTVLPAFPVICALLIWRTCLILSELPHFTDICSGSVTTLFQRTFYFNSASKAVAILIMAVLFSTGFKEDSLKETSIKVLQIYGLLPLSLAFGACILLFFVCRWEECITWEAYTMKSLNGLDYGSGMAHSFLHGYLKLILPAKGDNNKSIRERITDYMEEHKLTDEQFPVKKLIVFIPRSGFSFPTFGDVPSQTASDKDIEPAEALQDHLRNRAGTKQRVYRGGAYRIRIQVGNKISYLYALAEGATPVHTFHEAWSAGTPEAERLRQHRIDVTSNFYRTLQFLIDQDIQIRDLVTLIYYNDEDMSTDKDVIFLLKEFLLRSIGLP